VALWFDPDAAGRKARRSCLRSLGLLGITPRIIRTEKDPKLYSREEIRRIVYEE
jgi:DNA primase